ncbi:hypothetical protein PIB30_064152 [Stylosanthes scabra]|uniref:Uncharacterized protein n=1 Tax=Stylosanthes scabra TaxID=79078 RepID=A0ABU6TN88_9FABA|nr:hypothetical protein [Stylosanthes scabra]
MCGGREEAAARDSGGEEVATSTTSARRGGGGDDHRIGVGRGDDEHKTFRKGRRHVDEHRTDKGKGGCGSGNNNSDEEHRIDAEIGQNTTKEMMMVVAITAEDRLEYRPSWISEDSHVRMTFEVHKRVMEDKVMEFYAEVRHAGSSSRLSHPGPSTDPAPSHVVALEDVAMRGDNSGEDSDYEEESSSDSTEEDEEVLDTPVGWTRLVLPPPLPIPDLAQVPSFFQ